MSTHGQRGFTLLELLVVVAVLGLLLVALTDATRFAGDALRRGQRESALQGDLDSVKNVVRGLIASARAISGDTVRLRFVGTMPLALARGGLYDIELSYTDLSLTMSWTPHFKGPSPKIPPAKAVLATNLSAFAFEYYDMAGGWRPTMPEDGTPLLIRIAWTSSDNRNATPFTAAPAVDVQGTVTN